MGAHFGTDVILLEPPMPGTGICAMVLGPPMEGTFMVGVSLRGGGCMNKCGGGGCGGGVGAKLLLLLMFWLPWFLREPIMEGQAALGYHLPSTHKQVLWHKCLQCKAWPCLNFLAG